MADINTPDSVPATPDGLVDRDGLSSPASPGSADSSEASTPLEGPFEHSSDIPKRVPSLRTVSDPQNMTPSSTPLGMLSTARRPPPTASVMTGSMGSGAMNDIMAKARALHAQRMGKPAGTNPPPNSMSSSPASPVPRQGSPGGLPGGIPGNLKLPGGMVRPSPAGMPRSAPVIPTKPSLADRRRPQMKLSDMGGGPSPASPTPKLSDIQGSNGGATNGTTGSKMDDFKKYIDSDKGWITFDGAATITRTGVNFANGTAFTISLDEVEVLDELGKGNYGTVYRVRHTKPRVPRFGTGLSGFKHASLNTSHSDPSPVRRADGSSESSPVELDGTSGRVMAMKEIRLELEEAKFTTILKELVILHECVSPYIIDFYGAFFQEGAVYMCIEYMDGGSIDKLYTGGIPEGVLRKITYSTVMGLKSLKDEHNIIHRDVKPTNILVNTKGQVKICDFGVSGNLVASMAKTNIGCQSYMAPERISGGGMAVGADGTYSVQSDIWSLGLTIIECAMGRYPYPPEISSTIFSQLSAIVEGEPPGLPEEGYSATAHDFVKKCLNKVPKERPTYAALLQHPWMAPFSKIETIAEEAEEGEEAEAVADAVGQMSLSSGTEDEEVAEWVKGVLDRKKKGLNSNAAARPALHAAPLDSVSPTSSPALGASARLE
ncbi:mitogen activated protein kinase kinase [Colletotrichum karsti]|uniref:mitogen-activated protein kinase kinase n=1 Tax=Colletotrichum karsti TaxID=1095194 RepID=A0A9P6I364_9PEZI|nr:mitogen activated protein kinase kinase [Colletotrichum karsti]KAF9875199.1 mitogen activated protein kinase kinase [Colletotrichum karsti]